MHRTHQAHGHFLLGAFEQYTLYLTSGLGHPQLMIAANRGLEEKNKSPT